MALTPPSPLTLSTNASANTTITRKSYHIRRESAILKPKPKEERRRRSHTDVQEYHEELIKNSSSIYSKPSIKSKRKPMNRRFESPHSTFKCHPNHEGPHLPQYHHSADIESCTSYTTTYNKYPIPKPYHHHTDHYKDPLQDILQQFREIILPLQTEIKSLHKVTKELQDQVHILQEENAIYRKHNKHIHNDSGTNCITAPYIESIQNGYYDSTPNALNIPLSKEAPLIPNNSSVSVKTMNPVYLFSPPSKQTRTISNATLSRLEQINVTHKYLRPSDTLTQPISQQMEEDTLDIGGSAMKSTDTRDDGAGNEDVSVNIDICCMDHIQRTPQTISSVSTQSNIERTYHFAPSLSEHEVDHRSVPSPTPVSTFHPNPQLNASISVNLMKGEPKYMRHRLNHYSTQLQRNSFV